MSSVTIKMAQTDQDMEAARQLCREWMDWHWQVFPKDGPVEGNPMNPETFEGVIEDLPQIHARPRGGILLGLVDGRPAGCVMYHEAKPDTAEIKRLFVNDAGRGHRLGRQLLERMFEEMIADGYQHVIFSSARFLTHARRLYESVGFVDMPHPSDFPEHLRDFAYFMRRPLVDHG